MQMEMEIWSWTWTIGSGGACTGDTAADSLRAPCRPAVHGLISILRW